MIKHKASQWIYFLDIQQERLCDVRVFSKNTDDSLSYFLHDLTSNVWYHIMMKQNSIVLLETKSYILYLKEQRCRLNISALPKLNMDHCTESFALVLSNLDLYFLWQLELVPVQFLGISGSLAQHLKITFLGIVSSLNFINETFASIKNKLEFQVGIQV